MTSAEIRYAHEAIIYTLSQTMLCEDIEELRRIAARIMLSYLAERVLPES